jgi:hypothetical protein
LLIRNKRLLRTKENWLCCRICVQFMIEKGIAVAQSLGKMKG